MTHYYLLKKKDATTIITFSETLEKLEMTDDKYLLALRYSLKREQCFLKRNNLEVGINNYNKSILYLFESNMDIQFILNEYSVASYVVNYVTKIDAGLSKLLRDISEEKNNQNLKEKFRKMANLFLNFNLMSSQEATYNLLGLPLSKNSRIINTSPKEKRTKMIKLNKELNKQSEYSTDIFQKDLIEKYSERKSHFDECLADFASKFSSKYIHKEFDNEDLENIDELKLEKRNKPAILRFRKYNKFQSLSRANFVICTLERRRK